MAAITGHARYSHKHLAGLQAAAVELKPGNGKTCHLGRQVVLGEQLLEAHHERSSVSGLPASSPSGLSGGTCNVRNTPPMIREKAGAATRPP